MFNAFALNSLASRVRPGRAGLPTARLTPPQAAVPQTGSLRPPSRRRLTCTWVPDARTGRLSCVWSLEAQPEGEHGGSAPSRRLRTALQKPSLRRLITPISIANLVVR
jgi:hypothetical protein